MRVLASAPAVRLRARRTSAQSREIVYILLRIVFAQRAQASGRDAAKWLRYVLLRIQLRYWR